jgi:hypothetical protein
MLWILGCTAAAGVSLFILFTTGSLAAYIAAVVAALSYAVCMLPLRRRRLVAGGLIVLPIVSLLVLLYVPDFRHAAIRRAIKPGTTTRARVVWWTATSDMFVEKPLVGWGTGTYGSAYYHHSPPLANEARPTRGVTATHPHNEFLRLAAETGVVGLVLYCAMLATALVGGYRALRGQSFELRAIGFAMWAGLLGYITQAALGKGIQVWDMALPYWMLLGTVASASLWTPQQSPEGERRTWRWAPFGLAAVGLGIWWFLGGVGGYRSMVNLNATQSRLRGFNNYLEKHQEELSKPEVRQRIHQIHNHILPVLQRSEPQCPVPTAPLRFRYWLANNFNTAGLDNLACRHFRTVHLAAPGFLLVEKRLAFCELQHGRERRARKYLVDFLAHHPGSETATYITLARIDLAEAAGLLARQVAERDGFTHAGRTALLGRMFGGLGAWKQIRNLLHHTRRNGSRRALKALGEELTEFCREFGKEKELQSLREEYPSAFPSN